MRPGRLACFAGLNPLLLVTGRPRVTLRTSLEPLGAFIWNNPRRGRAVRTVQDLGLIALHQRTGVGQLLASFQFRRTRRLLRTIIPGESYGRAVALGGEMVADHVAGREGFSLFNGVVILGFEGLDGRGR